MILIADSGSTKTDWRLLDKGQEVGSFNCMGFNPYFQDTKAISKEIHEVLVPQVETGKISSVFFYGAGCSSEKKCKVVEEAIRENFPSASIEVDHDLLGAARGVCGDEEGIAAILGTGSNSCYYDGKEIKQQLFSLGYILGDEGSGCQMGKKLITKFLSDELDPVLAKNFKEEYKMTKEEILESIYKKELPSRFLASFSKFIENHIGHEQMSGIVMESFGDFFERQIFRFKKCKEVPMNCVGSIGFYFQGMLREVAAQKGVSIKRILKTPIEGLTLYHLQHY